MAFWGNLIGYQAVWLAIVLGAGRGQPWPGIVVALVFVIWQSKGPHWNERLRLVASALVLGTVIDGGLLRSGLLQFASPWPIAGAPPLWIGAIWAAFAVTLPRSMALLQGRPWLGAALGAVGGPLAYLGAARAGAVIWVAPPWQGLAALALTWALAMPLLAEIARRGARIRTSPAAASQASPP